jgi:uncharacterized SAM-binding protein YcdF (DUF218 family)
LATSISPAALLDPLLVLLVALGIALFLASRSRKGDAPARTSSRWGLRIAWLVWAIHWLFATPRFSFALLGAMEQPPTDVAAALGDTPEDRCAMVVLTGGAMSPRANMLGPERLAGASLPRAIGAARIYHERPVSHVIVTGRAEPLGSPDDTARAMADVMVAFGVPPERIIIEPLALDTRQNASFSTDLIHGLGATKTVLVTSALHMPRAVMEFNRAGLPVIAAPVDHRYEPPQGLAPYIPSISSMLRTGQVLHELLGRFKP